MLRLDKLSGDNDDWVPLEAPLDVPRPVAHTVVVAELFCVLSEFFVDLKSYPVWLEVVRWVNVVMLALFVAVLALRAVQNRRQISRWAAGEVVNIAIGGAAFILLFTVPRAGVLAIGFRVVLSALDWLFSTELGRKALEFKELRPSQSLALSFLGLIAFGSALLLFPAATVDGKGASLVDAAFTMSSATSGTGLAVQDTGSYFTVFGLLVLLFVIQVGSIGIMVFAASFAVLVGGRLPGHEAATLEEAGFGDLLDVSTVEGMRRLIYSVTLATLVIEIFGALSLTLCWATGLLELRPQYDNLPGAIWWASFHSISGFCHAGFSLEPDSLTKWVADPLICGIFVVLITLGGVGFPVMADLYPNRKRGNLSWRAWWRRLHIQTRVVLLATAIFYAVGTMTFLYFEYNGALAGMSVMTKINAAFFQSVSLRSAGFNTIDFSLVSFPTVIIASFFMFVGTAPASTGGGVRLTTIAVMLMAVRAMLRNREDVELMGRRLPKDIVYRSFSVVLIASAMIVGFLIFLGATQPSLRMEQQIFEAFSAFGTVGLSMGATGELDTTGKWLVTLLMYFGRVGPITLALAVGEKIGNREHTYPTGRIAVG